VIIPHFNSYPLQSAKKIDYGLWLQCINIKTAEKGLTLSSLEQIIAIKAGLNLGLSDKLKTAFSHVKVLARPEYIVSEGVLNPYWVTGFSDGDGCFTFSIREDSSRAAYVINLHKRDKPLLLKISEFFGSKGIVGSYGAQTSAEMRITSRSDLNTLVIPHFDKYQLSGIKQNHYLIWRQMVILITNKAHLTPDGLAKLKELKSTLNKN